MNEREVGMQATGARAPKQLEWVRTVGRCLRYLTARGVVVVLTVMIGVYAAIWVTNLGGHADTYQRQQIENGVAQALGTAGIAPWKMPEEQYLAIYEPALAAALAASDLDQPFFIRSFGYFRDAFSLSLGTCSMQSRSGSNNVKDILLEALPLTLAVFGIANLLIFFVGVSVALFLSRRYGSLLDRMITLSAPLFAAPPWFHGVLLIIFFASFLKILPFGGLIDPPYPETQFAYAVDVAKHMILPILALTLGSLPHAVYANRSLFLIHASDDHVELAVAKGLGGRRLQRRYVLRPVLPAIITNFAMISLVAWQGVILTEYVFNWPGIGRVLISAINGLQVAVIIGAVTMLAWLLGASILFLDLLYVLVDPRVSYARGGE